MFLNKHVYDWCAIFMTEKCSVENDSQFCGFKFRTKTQLDESHLARDHLNLLKHYSGLPWKEFEQMKVYMSVDGWNDTNYSVSLTGARMSSKWINAVLKPSTVKYFMHFSKHVFTILYTD